MGQRGELTGQVFGLLTVKSYSHTKKYPSGRHAAYWKVRCECGNEKAVAAGNLRSGRTRSCGCKERGLGKSRSYPGKPSWLSKMMRDYKSGARRRDIPFQLTINHLEVMVKSDCVYCGDPPSERPSGRVVHGGLKVNGIDRRDGKRGYTLENSVPCCTTCNRMKMAMSDEEFIAHVRKIAHHDH